MTQTLKILPLTKQAFAAFGDVIEPTPKAIRMINGGNTERHHALAAPEALGEDARIVLNLFRGLPRKFPFEISMMERHPLGSQSFSPLSGRPYLVVVSQDEDGKPGEPSVFLARGDQGVNYHRNVWHHPLMALDQVSDFLVADRDGPDNNLEEFFFDTPYLIAEF